MSAEAEAVHEEVESPTEESTEVEQEIEQEVEQEKVVESRDEEKVPLSALQKERRKRQEAERRADWMEQNQAQQLRDSKKTDETEDDDYEPVTKADLKKRDIKNIQKMKEELWIENNPEKTQEVNENLKEFLKNRSHLGLAIESAPNRYKEAWTLMNALTPKQKVHLKNPDTPKKPAPGSPSGVSKAAAMNESVDVMKMTDSEFNTWRNSQIKRR